MPDMTGLALLRFGYIDPPSIRHDRWNIRVETGHSADVPVD